MTVKSKKAKRGKSLAQTDTEDESDQDQQFVNERPNSSKKNLHETNFVEGDQVINMRVENADESYGQSDYEDEENDHEISFRDSQEKCSQTDSKESDDLSNDDDQSESEGDYGSQNES